MMFKKTDKNLMMYRLGRYDWWDYCYTKLDAFACACRIFSSKIDKTVWT